MKMNVLAFTLACLSLCACTPTNNFIVADYNKFFDEPYPPVTVKLLRNNAEFRESCHHYNQQSVLHVCTIDAFDLSRLFVELASSEQFYQVSYGESQTDYELYISIATYDYSEGSELAQSALAGATLMLMPLAIKTDIKVDAFLAWNGQPLKHYQYDLPFTEKVSLFTAHKDTEGDIAKMLASHLLKDFQKDNVFSPEFLWAELDASNYKRDLVTPKTAGFYLKSEEHQFQHPFQGFHTRYTHADFPIDGIDSYVYPIQHWDYTNKESMLKQEVLNIKEDIDIVMQTNGGSDLTLNEIESITQAGGAGEIKFLEGSFTNSTGTRIATYASLGIQKDKFVKLRASVEMTAPQDVKLFKEAFRQFNRDYFSGINVPEESLFMFEIRKLWRNKNDL